MAERSGIHDILTSDCSAPAGIWAFEGDQLVRIDRYHPDLDELVRHLCRVWYLEGDRIFAITPQDLVFRHFLFTLVNRRILSNPRPFPLPVFETMGSVTNILAQVGQTTMRRDIVREFFRSLYRLFHERIERRERFQVDDLEQYILSISRSNPVVRFLNQEHPHWLGSFSDEIRTGVLRDRRQAVAAFRDRVRVDNGLAFRGCCICSAGYNSVSELTVMACRFTIHMHCHHVLVSLVLSSSIFSRHTDQSHPLTHCKIVDGNLAQGNETTIACRRTAILTLPTSKLDSYFIML
ncbi:hypothetical protein MJO28_016337 [Puccinia striiformis f. sp. tritici]|uniref:Uncharacterized protein n=1 Tax=Puccinia striiformis f. sp. tritici TaxID=168172 RepID=A0ACC0DNQ8_9BASI|nr:hypothetical protein MJO28_016337 [Puccinia striiformis f. sp. tritici]